MAAAWQGKGGMTLADVEIGILTSGKPTLGMTLSSLLMQQVQNIRVYIVDTAEKPVINRDDVALRPTVGHRPGDPV